MPLADISWRVDVHREIFGIPFFPHGVLIAIGFLAGSWVLSRYVRRIGVSQDALWDVVTWVIIGSLIGTRLLWVLGNWSWLSSPAEALMIWHGGMTLYGGILGGLIAGVWKARKHGLPIVPHARLCGPGPRPRPRVRAF
ncbi:MAG: prolipoprotein diacylglyceryl transferase family protein [Actinomycetota bacterium]